MSRSRANTIEVNTPIPMMMTVDDENEIYNNDNDSNDIIIIEKPKSLIKNLYIHYPNLNIIIISIILWYILSMTISVYNRWMFSTEKLNFKYPIIITSFHQLLLTFLSIISLIIFPKFKLNTNTNNNSTGEKLNYIIPLKEYISKILPCSIASAGDIGLGNTSFRFITLSLYTMVKTSSLIFVLLWGVFFKLEKLTFKIFLIVIVMIGGVSMMIYGQNDNHSEIIKSTNFVFIGILLVLISSCMSGLRWALTQIMLKRNKHTKNPILTMLYVSPGMFIFLLIVGIIVEGFKNFLNADIWLNKGTLITIILIIIPGFLAFLMTIAEYTLLQNASLLTLSIAGIFKELLTIFVSWVIFDDKLSLLNIIGLIITFSDIICYNIYRYNENDNLMKNNQLDKVDNEFVDIEMDNVVYNK
ncbi:Ymd8 protein [Pichia kluyveri]|uniref:Ymd8 protein n=1 Tax=Pichia kluyveri TaxID=36015 RepID=A0AAV5QZ64_PICKL|nr:Ymd8 protein [Pichia kluyveri]